MPTIFRQDGFEVIIYIRDEHPPPHVHVWKAEGEAVIILGDEGSAPSLEAVFRLDKRNTRNALAIVEDNRDEFLRRWREIHG